MIKLQNLTPAVYYEQSRDFQFIGRLYDIVLNYIKTNTANLSNLPVGKNMDEQLLNLLALTLGFKPTKNYNSKQLRAVCSALPVILKHKGSIQALVLATNALLAAEGIKQQLEYTVYPKQGITLYIAQELDNLNLLTDLLDYLLPAGLSCTVIKESQMISTIGTTIGVCTDSVNVGWEYETKLSTIMAKPATDGGSTDKNEDGVKPIKGSIDGFIGTTPSALANVTIVRPPRNEAATAND